MSDSSAFDGNIHWCNIHQLEVIVLLRHQQTRGIRLYQLYSSSQWFWDEEQQYKFNIWFSISFMFTWYQNPFLFKITIIPIMKKNTKYYILSYNVNSKYLVSVWNNWYVVKGLYMYCIFLIIYNFMKYVLIFIPVFILYSFCLLDRALICIFCNKFNIMIEGTFHWNKRIWRYN
jgi:hypothetical protein